MAETPAIDETIDAAPGRKPGPSRWLMRLATPLLALGGLALLAIVIFDGAQSHDTARTIVGMIVMGLLWLAIDQFYLRPIERATIQRWGLTVDAEDRR